MSVKVVFVVVSLLGVFLTGRTPPFTCHCEESFFRKDDVAIWGQGGDMILICLCEERSDEAISAYL